MYVIEVEEVKYGHIYNEKSWIWPVQKTIIDVSVWYNSRSNMTDGF